MLKHEQIITTLTKAKELRPFVEKIITLGKKGRFRSKKKNYFYSCKINKNTKKVFDIFADRYNKRNGGYTRIVKLGNRYGDNAPTAVIELVDRDIEAKGKDSGPIIEKKSNAENEEAESN